ncbi:LamG-like jellyroll fold domain-containing protein [Flavobacterium sp.]|uniref:LamG-like jellyroll fold domain-containing protein n=1 Tax=Flavobacterium sp. TaxID=239 RepID=UPI003D14FB13
MKKITFLILILISFFTTKAQTALHFESAKSGQKVAIPSIVCPSEFTFEMWVNYADQMDNFATLLEFGNDAPYFGLEGQKPALYGAVSATTNLAINQWTHLAISYSASTQIAKIYINGHLDKTATGISLNTSGVGAGIGYNAGEVTFNGAIDEVRIWNTVRSDAEVLADMNTCLTGGELGLYLSYNFNEGSRTIIHDLSVNHYDGEILSMDPLSDWVGSPFCTTLTNEAYSILNSDYVFPNPSKGIVNVTVNTASEYVLYTVMGNQLLSGMFLAGKNQMDVSSLESGVYLLVLDCKGTNKKTYRLIKE